MELVPTPQITTTLATPTVNSADRPLPGTLRRSPVDGHLSP
jgi:hypothetical protein